MTEQDREVQELYELGQRNKKKLKFWPLMLLWCIIKTFLFPLLWVLGLTGTAISAYDSAQRER